MIYCVKLLYHIGIMRTTHQITDLLHGFLDKIRKKNAKKESHAVSMAFLLVCLLLERFNWLLSYLLLPPVCRISP